MLVQKSGVTRTVFVPQEPLFQRLLKFLLSLIKAEIYTGI